MTSITLESLIKEARNIMLESLIKEACNKRHDSYGDADFRGATIWNDCVLWLQAKLEVGEQQITSIPLEAEQALRGIAYEDDRRCGFDFLIHQTKMEAVKTVINKYLPKEGK